jgi:molybdopterin molybdotransferase
MTRTSWDDARRIAYGAAAPLPSESVDLAESLGRRLATPVTARQDIPHYDSSAMDGWAVAGDGPWSLVESGPLTAGAATVVVTGGVIPVGTVGVLRREFGETVGRMLRRTPGARPGEPQLGSHLRPAGAEAARGDLLIAAGIPLNPAHAAVAAAGGHDRVTVTARPRVLLLLTGDEVIESGLPAAGQVRDSYGVMLPAAIEHLGGQIVSRMRVRDTLDATITALGSAEPGHELAIVTGGTGLSDADHVRGALGALGATVLVESVAVRPGSPSMLARLPDGRLVIALAGNPLAAVMGLLTLAAPAIAGFAGAQLAEPTAVRVGAAVAGHPESTVLSPCTVAEGVAALTSWTGSGMLRGLADATAVLVVPPGGTSESGSARALPLPWR